MKNNKQTTLREKGQVLVVVALTLMALMAIIGLAVDTGYVYVSYSRLRRAVDAAALAATGEFKRGYTLAGMKASAMQELKLNGVITEKDTTNNPDVKVQVETCASNPGDKDLCPKTPEETAKKLVRIKVTQNVPMFFLSAWGFNRVPITIETISQAASIDLVLLIQNSESMASGDPAHPVADQNKDPNLCNPNGCHPFEEVKAAARDFVNNLMYFPYDRVSLVTFNKSPTMILPLSDQKLGNTIDSAITNLQVFNPPQCPYHTEDLEPNSPAMPYPRTAPLPPYPADPQGPCRIYTSSGEYKFFNCPMFWAATGPTDPERTPDNNPAWCGTTNPGAGLALAGNHLQGAYNYIGYPPAPITPIVVRDDAVWVILLLGTAAPNSAQSSTGTPLCPMSTRGIYYNLATCRDTEVKLRHCIKNEPTCMDAKFATDVNGIIMTSKLDTKNYDAYDNAFDMVDAQVANSVYLFTIGLGETRVRGIAGDIDNIPPGETFLKYAAKVGGGIYSFAPDSTALKKIFLEIANKIATKLTQ